MKTLVVFDSLFGSPRKIADSIEDICRNAC